MREKKRQQQFDESLVAWQAQRDELEDMAEAAATFQGAAADEAGALRLQLKRDERAVCEIGPCVLVEPRRGPGHYAGGSSGFSFRVAKGVNYRVGANRGTYVQGAESPTPIDQGVFSITNQRAVFMGAKQTREWAFSKLLGIEHLPDQPITTMHVSNRQKASGVLTGWDVATTVRFRIELGVALFNGTSHQLAQRLRNELAEVDATRPGGPVLAVAPQAAVGPAPVVLPPPGWMPDPTGRNPLRYWDGQQWTAHVADRAGSQGVDPL